MKNYKLLVCAIVAAVVTTGCSSSYNGSRDPVRVSDSKRNQTLEMLSQVKALELENADLKNQLELLQRQVGVQNSVYGQQGQGAVVPQQGQNPVYNGNDPYRQPQQQAPAGNQNGGYNAGTYTPPNQAPGFPAQQPNLGQNTQPQNAGSGGYGAQQPNAQNYPSTNNNGGFGNAPLQAPQQNQVPVVSEADAETLYDNGFNALKEGKYEEAIQNFQSLVQQHPQSNLTDDSEYWTGESYYVNGDFDNALAAFNRVVSVYPTSDRTPEAHLKIGYIYADRGDNESAKRVFSDVMALYPNDRAAISAKTKFNEL